MNVLKVREDFPILKDVIYLDSAATSLTPEPVLKAAMDYYYHYRANVGRGVYRTAQLADQKYRDAHKRVARFIGGRKGETAFTKNTTESINAVAYGLKWKKGDRIVATLLEHHSNLLPWMRLREKGIELSIVKPDESGYLDPSDFEREVDDRTRLVAVSHLSNVLGTIAPVKEISRICRDHGTSLLVDGAQSVPHMAVDVERLGCDFLCFSGHKMLGPTGAGVLWMRDADSIEPLLTGGGMVEDVSPDGFERKKGYEGFEAGTPDISAGIGLGAAVDYLERIGIDEIAAHETKLAERLLRGLQELDGVEIYGPKETKGRSGVISFNVAGLLPHEVALMLDQASNTAVRSGLHCCIPLMKHLGLRQGCVRASLYLYNTEDEVERLLATLEEIAKVA